MGDRRVPPRPTFSTSRPPFLTELLRRGPASGLVAAEAAVAAAAAAAAVAVVVVAAGDGGAGRGLGGWSWFQDVLISACL